MSSTNKFLNVQFLTITIFFYYLVCSVNLTIYNPRREGGLKLNLPPPKFS